VIFGVTQFSSIFAQSNRLDSERHE